MSVPVGQDPLREEEERKKKAVQALEILCIRKWISGRGYQAVDIRTDVILAADISTLQDQGLEVFYNLNDLALDIGRILVNVAHARNITVVTSDTGGTQGFKHVRLQSRSFFL